MNPAYDTEAARIEVELDEEIWDQLVSMYRETLPAKMASIEEAWARGAVEALGPLLHSLRGVSSSLAVHPVVNACAALEAALRNHEDPGEHYRNLLTRAEEVRRILNS